MAELLTLLAFCAVIAVCFVCGVSLTLSLLLGLFLFSAYVLYRRFSLRQLWAMIWGGMKTVGSVVPVFCLIGVLTALWRSCGTIVTVISMVSGLIRPEVVVPVSFLLCCLVSVLTGTSFGTAATMGVICITMGRAMGVSPALLAGAILSGSYFGDRCSPVSSSALLVCELTHTNIYDNIRRMVKTALFPFLLCCALYALLGERAGAGEGAMDIGALFSRELVIHPAALIPAALILLFALLRLDVKLAMSASIVSAALVSFFLQRQRPGELLRIVVLGFAARDVEVGLMLNGGGLLSMADVIAVLLIAAAFGGIFKHTQLLSAIRRPLGRIAEGGGPFAAVFCAALSSSLIACDQVLTIIMTHQLCGDLEPEPGELAVDIEDTAAVISPLMPWAIGSRVPLAALRAPRSAIPFALFLYLLPLCRLAYTLLKKRRTRGPSRPALS